MLATSTYYISAGGRGTRLFEVIEPDPELGVAKALLGHEGHLPLIDYHVQRSLESGYRNTVVNVGDQPMVAEHVRRYYGSHHEVSVISHEVRSGAGHDLMSSYNTAPDLFGAYTMLCNADTVVDVADRDVVERLVTLDALAVLVATTQKGVPNEGAFHVGQDGKVIKSDEFPHIQDALLEAVDTERLSSCGQIAMSLGCLSWLSKDHIQGGMPAGEVSIYKHLLPRVHERGGLYVYNNGDKLFVDIGTPDNYAKFLSMDPVTPRTIESVA